MGCWRRSQDDHVYDLGWLVDDVWIYACGFLMQAPVDFDADATSDIMVFRGGVWLFHDFDIAS